jgi:phosphohistidine phosphatase
MRHAKSSWDDPSLTDYQRSLSARGKRDAQRIAQFLADSHVSIDLAYVSSAKRTVETFSYLKSLRIPESKFLKNHYLANYELLLKRIKKTKKDYSSILLLNHEPACKDLTTALAQSYIFPKKKFMKNKFSTAAIAFLEFDCRRWDQIASCKAVLKNFITPKSLN